MELSVKKCDRGIKPHILALDIGAGSKKFARAMRRMNPHVSFTLFCGDVFWRFPKDHNTILSILERKKSGIFKLVSYYENLSPFPFASLDLIAINAPHPLSSPKRSFFREAERVLRPGGILYFGHTMYNWIKFQDDDSAFDLVNEGTRFPACIDLHIAANNIRLKLPMSPVMKSNLKHKKIKQKRPDLYPSDYLYKDVSVNPGYRAWRKS